jgi:hypothetical protein
LARGDRIDDVAWAGVGEHCADRAWGFDVDGRCRRVVADACGAWLSVPGADQTAVGRFEWRCRMRRMPTRPAIRADLTLANIRSKRIATRSQRW